MTNQTLFEWMSEIDSDLIERAEAPVPMRKKPILRVALIAAVVALMMSVCVILVGVAGTVAAVNYQEYVEENYPEYDGTVLHLLQILLTEDQNRLSSMLSEDVKQAIGNAIAALRQGNDGSGESDRESVADPEEQTRDPETETEPSEQTTDGAGVETEQEPEQTTDQTTEQTSGPEETAKKDPLPPSVVVHTQYDRMYLLAGDEQIEVFTEYEKWNSKVEVTDPAATHVVLRGWMAFGSPDEGTYGYSIDNGERVYDKLFSKEPESLVFAVAKAMGGKSCSRMEITIPIGELTPGKHRVGICVRSYDDREVEVTMFYVIIPENAETEIETGPNVTDNEPEQGWSEGLAYTQETRDGQTVYIVSGIGTCTDAEVYIPPTYKGYPVVAIGKDAFMSAVVDYVYVPSTVKEIGESAFFDCAIRRVTLSEGLEVIGESAFADAWFLEEIQFPSTLQSIGSWAFTATDIAQVILPDSVTEVGGYAFSSCLELKEIKLSAGLTEIKPSMLSGIRNIQSIQLPKGVQVIGNRAFTQCGKLESVTVHHGVTKIGDSIFEHCDKIREIRFVGTPEEWESIAMSEQAREQLTPLVVYVEE